jgi:hypothetical protein
LKSLLKSPSKFLSHSFSQSSSQSPFEESI